MTVSGQELTPLSKERQGEIALALVKDRIKKDGIELKKDELRNLGNISARTGIPIEDLKQFARLLIDWFVPEFVEECLS